MHDFHTYCNNTLHRFDLVVGNPPYIRYQFFDRIQQVEASDIFIKAGLTYSKLTNAWVSFVVGSSLLLERKWWQNWICVASRNFTSFICIAASKFHCTLL